MRGLLMGAFCTVLVLAVAVTADPASAKAKRKKGPSICTSVQAPFCLPPLLVPVCTKKNACGGCQAWVCRPIFWAM